MNILRRVFKAVKEISEEEVLLEGYITRDKNKNVYFSYKKPFKKEGCVTWEGRHQDYFDKDKYDVFSCFRMPNDRRKFKKVKWEDSEPHPAQIRIYIK